MGEFILFLLKRKWFLLINFFVIFVIAAVFAFGIAKKEFRSQITFLPSPEQATSALSMIGISIPSMSGQSVLNDQIGIIFESNSIKRQIIEKFGLYDLFKLQKNPAKFERTCRLLPKYVQFKAEEKGSLGFAKTLGYSITCYHPSADTAMLLCQYSFSLLDSAIRNISMFRAHRNRVFIEGQLLQHRRRLDSLQDIFGKFQLTHKAFVVPEQFKLSLKNYAEIKSAALLNEMKMQTLEKDFHGDLPGINELKQNQTVYDQKLSQIESSPAPDVLPSIEHSARLLPEYTNLLRDIGVEEQVNLLFTKELETSRIEESRNVSPLVTIDNPYASGYKARPKRLVILLLFVGVENLLLLLILYCQFLCTSVLPKKETVRAFLDQLRNT